MRARCQRPPAPEDAKVLAWLAAQDPADRPVLLYSGGPRAADARWHFAARRPEALVRAAGEGARAELLLEDARGRLLARGPAPRCPEVLRAFAARLGARAPAAYGPGLVGYLAYETAWWFEYGLPPPPAGRALPLLHLAFHAREWALLERGGGRRAGDPALLAEIEAARPRTPRRVRTAPLPDPFPRPAFEAAVRRIAAHCRAGDLFQADLTRRVELAVAAPPAELFARLARVQPAPYAAFLQLDPESAVLSVSPEEFLVLERGRARARPIKGSLARAPGRSPDELLASVKDRAELAMIVDLVRNDLGRTARPGSVRVRAFPELLAIPGLWHLRATIEAEAAPGRDLFDLLAGALPAGSIVGAPKPRAIEILAGLETRPRGPYTGVLGWIGGPESARLSVAIRTGFVERGVLAYGVGGGITVLSDPAAEYEETVAKAAGFRAAFESGAGLQHEAGGAS